MKLKICIFCTLTWTVCVTFTSAQETPSTTTPEPSRIAVANSNTNRQYAWNRDDKYVPPDFEGYFAKEDLAAATRLHDFMIDQKLCERSPNELLNVVRRGLRSTKTYKSKVLDMVAHTFLGNKSPQNPVAVELMYHACSSTDPDTVHCAMYMGVTVVADRSDNLVRMMMMSNNKFDREIQERIHWSFKTYGDQQKTALQLAKLLDDNEQIGIVATLAAYDAYKRLTGKEPPQPERFANLGLWVIGFHHSDVLARDSKGPDLLRAMLREELKLKDDKLVDFVGRIDGDHWVGVALISGLSERERLAEQIKNREPFALDFVEKLNERLFQTRRLREFAKYWPQEVPNAKPAYTLPDLNAVYSWNCEDGYEAPNFANFFPDDEAAGKRLDELYLSREKLTVTDRELLDAFRQGLRRSSVRPNGLFGWLSTALNWPKDPFQTEIIYHAADPAAPQEIRYNSVYFGLGNFEKKSDNVLRLFGQILATEPYDRSIGHNLRQRIIWSLGIDKYEKEFLAGQIAVALNKHRNLDFLTLVTLDAEYRELTGNAFPNRKEYTEQGAFFFMFRRNGINSDEQLKTYVAEQLASSKYWLAFAVRKNNNEIGGMAVVRGLAGMEWLISELQKDKANMCDMALPFSKNSIKGTELDKISEFQSFVVDDIMEAKK